MGYTIMLMHESGFPDPVIVDGGPSERFVGRLKPEALARALAARRQVGAFRLREGYDLRCFFATSLMGEHVAFRAEALWR